MAANMKHLPGFLRRVTSPSTSSFSGTCGLFTLANIHTSETTSMTSDTYQMGRQPAASKMTGARKNAMMVPTGIHSDQMPMTRPWFFSGKRRGMILGPMTHMRP